jgi:ribosome-associated toxin RatA of RatAB toxin-antitoxin module
MVQLSRSALLPHPAEQVYKLINDIEAYPRYMEGCVGAQVLERGERSMVARLELSRGGIRQSLTTRNHLQEPYEVELELVSGPFKRFEGRWVLQPLGEDACKVTLTLGFTLSNRVLGIAAKRLFNSAANDMVEAMVKRAAQLYGRGDGG